MKAISLAVVFFGSVYYAMQGGSNMRFYGWDPKVWSFKWKQLSSNFLWKCWLCMLYKVLLTSESMDKILKCDNASESCIEKHISMVLFIMLYKVGLTSVGVCGWNPKVWPFKWKLLSSTFLWYCLLCCTRCSFYVDEILKCGPFKWKLLSCIFLWYAIYYAAQDGCNFCRRLWMKFLSVVI